MLRHLALVPEIALWCPISRNASGLRSLRLSAEAALFAQEVK